MFLYDISDKNLIGPKLSRIRHDKIDGFIKIYSGSKYLVLLVPEKYDAISYLKKHDTTIELDILSV